MRAGESDSIGVFHSLSMVTKSNSEKPRNNVFSKHLLSQKKTPTVTYQVHFNPCAVFIHFCGCVSQGQVNTYSDIKGIVTKHSSVSSTKEG